MLTRRILFPAIWIIFFVLSALPVLAEVIVDTAWVRRYNGSGGDDWLQAMAVDRSGNVCVTGYTLNGSTYYDYATVKYYPNGDTAWVRRYTRPGNWEDNAYAIVADASGNFFVTGACHVDAGNVDVVTIKYLPDGDTAWVTGAGGPGTWEEARAISVDGAGNVFVTGLTMFYIISKAIGMDYLSVKYGPEGDTVWTRTYSGPENYWDFATAVALDGLGNVCVTGRCGFLETAYDYATVKYDPSGNTVWVNGYNGPGNDDDYAEAMAVDDMGNVYVTGFSLGDGTNDDYATIKYNLEGDTFWVRRYNGPENGTDRAFAIAVDSFNNVYVTGYSQGDFGTVKYYSNGDTAWVRRYDGPAGFDDCARAIALDHSGNVYVTGDSRGSGSGQDYATVKYDSTGRMVWVARYNGPGNGDDRPFAIAVDDLLNVYIAGQSLGDGTSFDYATIKYFQALRGDVSRDWIIDLSDVICLLNYLFKGGPAPEHMVIGDCNCDAIVDLGDAVFLLNYLFKGGPPPDCP